MVSQARMLIGGVAMVAMLVSGPTWAADDEKLGLAAALGRCTGIRRMGAAFLLSAPTSLIVTTALLSLGG